MQDRRRTAERKDEGSNLPRRVVLEGGPRSKARLSREDRQEQIMTLLKREGAVQIAGLAAMFQVTTETARRDLDELARQGLVKRTYGGAAHRSLTDEPEVDARGRTHVAERARVAEKAAALVGSGEALMIDCGSTTALLARALAQRDLALTVITNCIAVATALGASQRCRVILCPGHYVAREGGLYGSDTLEFLRRFTVDRAFIGASGLTLEGPTDADSRSCWVKRVMIERAGRTALVMDSSKFGAAQFELVCPLDALSDLVVEAAPPAPLARALTSAGTLTHLAL